MDRELCDREMPESGEVILADLAAILQINERQALQEQTKNRREAGPRDKRRRCVCGKCRACVDNARWEAVFQAKFADPDYYALRHPKQGSALGGFR